MSIVGFSGIIVSHQLFEKPKLERLRTSTTATGSGTLCVILFKILRTMNKIVMLLSFVILMSCTHEKKQESYHILTEKELGKNGHQGFYGYYNFILIDTAKVFVHNKYQFFWCATGLDTSKPPLINLTPDDLREIPINELEGYLETIPDTIKKDFYLYTSISTSSDTIKNRGFKIISNYLNKNKISNYCIRKFTEEEHYSLYSKINKTNYDVKTIIWKQGFNTDWQDSIRKTILNKKNNT